MRTLSIIFAKEPVPGQVKTRFTPPLNPEIACRLYHGFLEDILEESAQLPGLESAIFYAPAAGRGFFQKLAPAGVRLAPQEGRDLGERMARAVARGFAAGFSRVLLRGSDTPDLPGAILLEAKEILEADQAEVVLGPASDGGYYLVGLKTLYPELFQGLPWSGSMVLAETLRRARRLSLRVHLLNSWPDIDTYADLLRFLQTPHPPPRPGWRSHRLARELLLSKDGRLLY